MNDYETTALLRLRDAALSTRPMIERLGQEQQEVKDILTTFRVLMGLTPVSGTELLLGQLERVRRQVDALYGLVLMLSGTVSQVAAVVSEHREPAETAHSPTGTEAS
jgi:hypothetical protein